MLAKLDETGTEMERIRNGQSSRIAELHAKIRKQQAAADKRERQLLRKVTDIDVRGMLPPPPSPRPHPSLHRLKFERHALSSTHWRSRKRCEGPHPQFHTVHVPTTQLCLLPAESRGSEG